MHNVPWFIKGSHEFFLRSFVIELPRINKDAGHDDIVIAVEPESWPKRKELN